MARLRERGHSLKEIRTATDEGRLAFGYIEELFAPTPTCYTLAQAVARDRARAGADRADHRPRSGSAARRSTRISEDELQLLRYVAAVLDAGLPLVAMLQLVRVYGQAMAQVADAEVRLFHLYVHEPLMRSGATGSRPPMRCSRSRAGCCRCPRR